METEYNRAGGASEIDVKCGTTARARDGAAGVKVGCPRRSRVGSNRAFRKLVGWAESVIHLDLDSMWVQML